jgi:hypothetical protein
MQALGCPDVPARWETAISNRVLASPLRSLPRVWVGSFPFDTLGVWRSPKYSVGRSPSHSVRLTEWQRDAKAPKSEVAHEMIAPVIARN